MIRFKLLTFFICIYTICLSQDNLVNDKKAGKYYYELGEKYFSEGKMNLALAYYDSSIMRFPQSHDALFSRALTKEELNDSKGAITDYTAAYYLNPELSEALWNRATLYYKMENYILAYDDFNSLMSKEDLSVETNAVYYGTKISEGGVSQIGTIENLNSSLYNYLGLTSFKLGKFNEAISYFNQAIENSFDVSDYYVNRSLVWEKLKKPSLALDDLKSALEIDPSNEIALINLTRLDEESGNHKNSINNYSVIINNNPVYSEAYAKRGIAKLNAGDYNGAKIDYDSAIKYDSKDYRKWLNRGIIKSKLKDYDGAISDLNKSIKINASNEEAFFELGSIYSKLRSWTQASYNFTRAINNYSEYGEAYYNRAIAYYYSGQKDQACYDLDKALQFGILSAEDTKKRMCN